jgi:hypothetical protein
MAKDRPLADRRLLGTWRSDRRKTFRHFVPGPGATPAGVRKLRGLFGRLAVRWTAARYHLSLDGTWQSAPYEVLGRDAESVVVRYYDPRTREWRLQQLRFEGRYYWLWAWGLREYFRRVE